MARVIQATHQLTDVTITAGTETVAIVSDPIILPTRSPRFLVIGWAQAVVDMHATSILPRLRRGSTTTGTLITRTVYEAVKATNGASRFVEQIEVVNGEQSLAADSVAAPEVPQRVILTSEDLNNIRNATLELAYAWAATADGTIQLYDVTAGSVVAETTAKTGGESSEREQVTGFAANLTAGNEIKIRANITTAGAAGETVTIRKATLRLIKYPAAQVEAFWIMGIDTPVGLSATEYCLTLQDTGAAANWTVRQAAIVILQL